MTKSLSAVKYSIDQPTIKKIIVPISYCTSGEIYLGIYLYYLKSNTDLTLPWNDLTWNNLTMQQSDCIPSQSLVLFFFTFSGLGAVNTFTRSSLTHVMSTGYLGRRG